MLRVLEGGGMGPPVFEAPPQHCPKCIERHREDAQSCARCGLVFVNFEPEQVALRPELVEAWREVHSRWDDPGAHEYLLYRAEEWGALAELGRLYRIRLAVAPNDARAHAARERIVTLATSAALAPSAAPRTAPKVTRVLAIVLVGLLALGILGLLWRMANR